MNSKMMEIIRTVCVILVLGVQATNLAITLGAHMTVLVTLLLLLVPGSSIVILFWAAYKVSHKEDKEEKPKKCKAVCDGTCSRHKK